MPRKRGGGDEKGVDIDAPQEYNSESNKELSKGGVLCVRFLQNSTRNTPNRMARGRVVQKQDRGIHARIAWRGRLPLRVAFLATGLC